MSSFLNSALFFCDKNVTLRQVFHFLTPLNDSFELIIFQSICANSSYIFISNDDCNSIIITMRLHVK